jgi:ribosomal protein S18 acetylase RimI-like enzyme
LAAEIIDIRRFNGRAFLPILRREGQVWAAELLWDYSSSEATILKILEERRLSGFALVEASRILGYCFFFYEGEKGLVGNLFVEHSCPQVAYAERLLDHSLETLLATPGIHRVETQLPHFSMQALEPSFRARGFVGYRRSFMVLNLRKSETLSQAERRPESAIQAAESPMDDSKSEALGQAEGQPTYRREDFEIAPWERSLDRPAAQLIYITYRHHVDALINDQYASESGAARLIENIVQHRGCGDAVPGASRVALHRATGKLAGLLAITAVRPHTAHIPQIAVAPEFQGVGLGSEMMAAGFGECQRQGFEEVSLTVTDSNSGAVRLYERLGFETFRTFGAFVWNRTR